MLAKATVVRPAIVAASGAGLVAILAAGVPYQGGITLAVLAGTLAGWLADARALPPASSETRP
jgi:hypothetical protein